MGLKGLCGIKGPIVRKSLVQRGGRVLGLILLNDRLTAIHMKGATVLESFGLDIPQANPQKVGEALETALLRTHFKGKNVVLLLEPDSMEHTYLKVPAVERKELEKILEIRMQAQFPGGGMVHCHTPLLVVKGEQAAMLHTMPAEYLEVFLAFCRKRRLTPIKAAPISALLQPLLRKQELKKGEFVLVSAEIHGRNFALVGDGEGRVAFERYMQFEAQKDGERQSEKMSLEINRLTLYMRQQLGININRVCLAGDIPSEVQQRVAAQIPPAVQFAALSEDLPGWLAGSLAGSRQTAGFLTREMIVSFHQKRYLTATAVSLGAFCVYSAAVFLWLEGFFKDHGEALNQINALSRVASHEADSLRASLEEIKKTSAFSSYLKTHALDPVPGWFAGYLGDATPPELTLTDLSIAWDPQKRQWAVQMEGLVPPGLSQSAMLLERYQARLSAAPFRMQVQEPWTQQWNQNLQSGATSDGEGRLPAFRIKGFLP